MPLAGCLDSYAPRRGAGGAGRRCVRRAAARLRERTCAVSRSTRCVYMLLALGLNVVVGWGGLLDLGYVAFFGIGAYTYAFLASEQVRPAPPDAPGDPARHALRRRSSASSWRCRRSAWSGDYLAIVTLFFLQIFNSDAERRRAADEMFGWLDRPHGWAERNSQHRPVQLLRARDRRVARGRLQRRPTCTSLSPCSPSCTCSCGSSITRAPDVPGARCGRIRSQPS